MITLVYLIPTVIALGVVGTDDVEWTAGAFTVVAEAVGGTWLAILMSIGAVDFGITQVVDGNWGVHASIPKALFRTGESG